MRANYGRNLIAANNNICHKSVILDYDSYIKQSGLLINNSNSSKRCIIKILEKEDCKLLPDTKVN